MSRSTPRNRQTQGKARGELNRRPINELAFDVTVAPPDGETTEDGNIVPVTLHIELRNFTLGERQLVKRCLGVMAQPPDWEDVLVVHAFVVWKRTHPDALLSYWMEHITWGDLLDGLLLDPAEVVWDTTPPDYDPKA